MRVRIKHITRYSYDEQVTLGPHIVRLFPANHLSSELLTYNLSTNPKATQRWQTDAWGNRLCRLTFDGIDPAEELAITVDGSFDLMPVNPFDFFIDADAAEFPVEYSEETREEFAPFLRTGPLDDSVREWMEKTSATGAVIDYLVAINQRVANDIGHIIRLEPGLQTPAETLELGSGSCRDSAWLLCTVLRERGFIARFVSGYLIQLEDEGNIPGVQRGMDEDVLDLHAWAEVFLPGAGWIGMDSTSGLLCAEGHIPLSSATQPSFAAPLAGSYGKTGKSSITSSLSYTMEIERIGHQPRPRKPYTDAQYKELLAAGDVVDARLQAAGVTLAIGGEPTWTSREHPNEPEWTTGVGGQTKTEQGTRFAEQIRERLPDHEVTLHTLREQTENAIALEGSGPPADARLGSVEITPAPGVLAVNIPVQTSTRGYSDTLHLLAEAAAHSGLCTERFQLDGRSAGSGGGNHITLGGTNPDDSVFLNRPDVLASLLRFANNHPALSYFFGGAFVGPASRAPRADEGRPESLDELELGLGQLHRGNSASEPQVIDGLLRNLLADVSGDTRRTEISIDKLFSSSSAAGRLGIVELRAFEMPPNERMATAQAYLMRALVAAFVETPYQTPLTRWGDRLHDRFMLPTLLWDNLLEILDHLDRAGFSSDPAWFAAFMEYRFPVMGRMRADGVEIEVRPALEPWPLLSRDPTTATNARVLDSSVERIELVVRGLNEERHEVAVNGFSVPLHATRNADVRVAGVRFKAWQPAHCLQPHIGVQHPLDIDLLDTTQRRSIAGAAYHVWHPNGQAFEKPPLTEFEATSRRNSRFTRNRHMPHPAEAVRAPSMATRGVTLDLRWTDSDDR